MQAGRTSAASVDRWVRRLPPRPLARIRLLCFPHAGGGASAYRRWCDLLPDEIEPLLIQLPGRENRLDETLFSELAPLIDVLRDALQPALQPPFALFGCSMGALVAFELARALRAAGCPDPAHLLVAVRGAPQLPPSHAGMHDLAEEDLLAEVRRLSGTPAEVMQHAELMRLMLPVLRADLRICETYRYQDQPPLNCPISAFAARNDPGALPGAVAAWKSQTTSRFHLHIIEGGHFVVQTAAAPLAGRISADLMQTVAGWRSEEHFAPGAPTCSGHDDRSSR
jgi:medium-chain acyl-[acyl-carrier-protein] hydrolase